MAGLFRVRAVWSGWEGAAGLSTFYFDSTDPMDNTKATECAARVRAYLNAIRVIIPTPVSMQVLSEVDILESTTGTLTGIGNAGAITVVNGNGGTSFAPIASMALGRLATPTIINGRNVKGRTFIGPISLGEVTASGTLTSGAQSTVVTGLGLLSTVISSSAVSPVVWHRPRNGAGGASAPVTSVSCPTKLSVLRSRRD